MPVPRAITHAAATLIVATSLVAAVLAPLGVGRAALGDGPAHLVVSEVMTGGAGASDEFVELYNPTLRELPLEGLELIYVTATGSTISRKAEWALGSEGVPPGGHVLVANELGVFAAIADAVYSGGLAATGGSMALRIQGASTAVDAVGWGTAASPWIEGVPAEAPAAGSSLERLPGGALGSTRDTDDNAADFVTREVPDPQNSTSPPVPAPTPTPDTSAPPAPTDAPTATPGGSVQPSLPTEAPSGAPDPTPTPTPVPPPTPTPVPPPTPTPVPTSTTPITTPTPAATPSPATVTPAQTPSPEPSPAAEPISIAAARALADGSVATIRATTLTPSAFTDGGGYVADATGAIAVLVSGATFERGSLVTATGVIDDRFAQRTLRVEADGLVANGTGMEPAAVSVPTGAVAESVEGTLVRTAGAITGSPTTLTGGLAFDIDDGSGAVRVLIVPSTGISAGDWARGTRVELRGVVGQRDSTGSGASGYRIQPRDPADILAVTPPPPSATPAPTQTPAVTRSATPRPSGLSPPTSRTPQSSRAPEALAISSIAEARAAESGAHVRIRGVVTLGTGIADASTAAVQDATGAIVLRTGDEAGDLARGQLVDVTGTRSTLGGMETIRVSDPATYLGGQPEPPPIVRTTGMVGESDEAILVAVRGAIAAAPRRSSAGNVSLSVDDGSGATSVFVFAATGIATERLVRDAWIEVVGIVGQETSGSQPESGYRIWPRDASDVRVLASPTAGSAGTAARGSAAAGGRTASGRASADTAVPDGGSPGLAALLPGSGTEIGPDGVQATLVAGEWPEVGVSGIVWDGARAIGLAHSAAATRQVGDVIVRGGPPAPIRLIASSADESLEELELPIARLDAGSIERVAAALHDPLSHLPDTPGAAWVRLTGRLSRGATGLTLIATDVDVSLDERCNAAAGGPTPASGETVTVEGLADGRAPRLVIGCDAIRIAPALAPGAGDATPTADRSLAKSEPVAASPSGDAAKPGALLLLGAAATGLTTAGALAWRRGTLDRVLAWLGQRHLSTEEQTDLPSLDPDPEPEGQAPRLELVPLPDESRPIRR